MAIAQINPLLQQHRLHPVRQCGNRHLLWLSAIRQLALGVLMAIAFTMSWVSPVWAQDATPSPAPSITAPSSLPPRSGLDVNDISSEKVSQFVRAYLAVLGLFEQHESELQGAETDLESLRLEREVEQEAFQHIEAEGLTLQEYLQLLRLANIDPEFGERIALQLQEMGEY